MKYPYNKREGLGNKALTIKTKKGSFMDRFKGKTSQMNKEGHMGKLWAIRHLMNSVVEGNTNLKHSLYLLYLLGLIFERISFILFCLKGGWKG